MTNTDFDWQIDEYMHNSLGIVKLIIEKKAADMVKWLS